MVSLGFGMGFVVGKVVWNEVKVAAGSLDPMSIWYHVAVG